MEERPDRVNRDDPGVDNQSGPANEKHGLAEDAERAIREAVVAEPRDLAERLERTMAMLAPGGLLALGIGILGEGARPPGSPLLAHLLFPDLIDGPVAAWDASSFRAWLAARCLEVVAEGRRELEAEHLRELDRSRRCLRGLSLPELRVRRIEMALRRREAPGPPPPDDRLPFDAAPLEHLDGAAARLAASLRPGLDLGEVERMAA